MKNFIYGIIFGVLLLSLIFYLFLKMGGMPVATQGKPLPFERFIVRTALHAAMDSEIHKPSPIPNTEANINIGAKIYVQHCSVCHGLEGNKPSFIALGLFPKPPQLLDPDHGVTDVPVGETYWKVKNGIRLTGMPGFVANLSETEMWQVAQFLFYADKLPTGAHETLKRAH
jgi:thiosulfate dehydrogenase